MSCGLGDGYPTSSRRKASVDTIGTLKNEERRRASPDVQFGRRSEEADRDAISGRRPSGSISTQSDSTTTNATNAQREMIIPNKSTIAEEEIEVPYGRERESSGTALGGLGRMERSPEVRDGGMELRETDGEGMSLSMSERERDGGVGGGGGRERSRERDADMGVRSPPMGLSGLSGLSARLRERTGPGDEDDEDNWSGPGKSGEEYYDKMSFGRASVASDRSVGYSGIVRSGSTGGGVGGSSSSNIRASKTGGVVEDMEGVRRDYEFKIATMQGRIATLERELEDAEERERRLKESGIGLGMGGMNMGGASAEKVAELEAEVRTYKEVGYSPLSMRGLLIEGILLCRGTRSRRRSSGH